MKLHVILIFLCLCVTSHSFIYDLSDYPGANIVITWNNQLLKAIHSASPPPTIVSRSLAMVHTAIYDAWSFYNPPHHGVFLVNNVSDITDNYQPNYKDVEKAISFAAYRVIVDLFPLSKDQLDSKMTSYSYDINDKSIDLSQASGVGNMAAIKLFEFRHTDGSNQKGEFTGKNYTDYTNYGPRNDPQPAIPRYIDNWQPLRVPLKTGNTSTQNFATPHWSMVKPFGMKVGSQLRPTTPPPYSSGPSLEQLKKSAYELINITAHMTDEIKAISEYWADGPESVLPPGHWNLFAQWVSQRDQHDIAKDVKLFFMLGNAVMDAGISCWDTKRFYDNARPATMIPYLFNGTKITGWNGVCKENVTFDLANWYPYQNIYVYSPPFSDYTSGHSTFSEASAEILRRFTGSDQFGASITVAKGSSTFETSCGYPVPSTDVFLQWPTFTDASLQAGYSRRLGGIHYDFSDTAGREVGSKVADLVWKKAQIYFSGRNPALIDDDLDGVNTDDLDNSGGVLNISHSFYFILFISSVLVVLVKNKF
ncbi:hypothetical protein CYY_003227 [Polysphondylium violaceum]|uniref:Phosphoesterase n=1 Tax=Polysphondylium violaceum TaxID=133409 RepID=A0A8J4Q739_9MYCE|nr:hypothetical protein CYY_003227 [Polysphondylium violaceum]